MSKLTEQAIRQAFRDMLADRSLDTITVTELVHRCGINRKTFYRHYSSLGALASALASEGLMQAIGEDCYPENWQRGMLRAFAWLKENRKAVENIYASVYYEEVRRSTAITIHAGLEKNLTRALEIYRENTGRDLVLKPDDTDLVLRYFTTTVQAFLEEYIALDMRYAPASYVERMELLIFNEMYPIFDRFYAYYQKQK